MSELYPRLWRFAIVLTGRRDWAEDLTQQVCLKAIESAGSFRAGSHLDRWLFRIARNTWYNELRARQIRQGGGLVPVEEAALTDHGPGPETAAIQSQAIRVLHELPEAQRVTALLVYAEGLTYRETAELLEVPIGTVMSRLAAARRKMADRLAVKNDCVGTKGLRGPRP